MTTLSDSPATAASSPEERTPRRPTSRKQKRNWSGWLFVGPFVVVFVLVFIIPVLYAVYLSFFQQKLFGGNSFVGAQNYIDLMGDGQFWESLLRVALLFVVQVPIMLGLALFAALAIDSARLHRAGLFRILLFLPYAVPGVFAVLVWGYVYGPNFGLAGNINDLLGSQVIVPFAPEWILASIGNIITWQFVGYNMLIFYSALRTIPGELFEAADLDGAGPWRVITGIKLPALRGALVIATIFSVIGSFQTFNEPNILKPLAPNIITTFFTPNMYAYNLTFAGQQYNYSATVAIVMGLLTAVIAYVVQLRGSRAEDR